MVITLKHKKSITCAYALQKFLDKPIRKPNKTWVDKGSEVYNRSVKPWLQDKNIEICSIYNEGKSVAAERFVRTLKKKMYKYMNFNVRKYVY